MKVQVELRASTSISPEVERGEAGLAGRRHELDLGRVAEHRRRDGAAAAPRRSPASCRSASGEAKPAKPVLTPHFSVPRALTSSRVAAEAAPAASAQRDRGCEEAACSSLVPLPVGPPRRKRRGARLAPWSCSGRLPCPCRHSCGQRRKVKPGGQAAGPRLAAGWLICGQYSRPGLMRERAARDRLEQGEHPGGAAGRPRAAARRRPRPRRRGPSARPARSRRCATAPRPPRPSSAPRATARPSTQRARERDELVQRGERRRRRARPPPPGARRGSAAGCGWCITPVTATSGAPRARALQASQGSQPAACRAASAGRRGGAVAEQVGAAVLGDRVDHRVALGGDPVDRRVGGAGQRQAVGVDLGLERVPLGGDRRGERLGRQRRAGCRRGCAAARSSRSTAKPPASGRTLARAPEAPARAPAVIRAAPEPGERGVERVEARR